VYYLTSTLINLYFIGTMIQVENINFSYNRRRSFVLKDFSLNLEQGYIYGLLGRNGAGKSTLLYLMSGLLTPDAGCAKLFGKDIRLRLPETLEKFFLIPEEFDVPPVQLQEFVKRNGVFYPNFSEQDLERYLGMFGMSTDLHLKELSMGQKKKVLISFALAANTPLLLMDEPTNGLDIPSKSQFRKILASGMNDERTILISTHQVRDVDRMLDHIIIMDHSRIVVNQSTLEISKRLYFTESNDKSMAENALYALPSPMGNYLLLPNDHEEDSLINLELLFGAAIENEAEITRLLNPVKA